MTSAGTSNELDVQNEWEENTHTHTHKLQSAVMYCTIMKNIKIVVPLVFVGVTSRKPPIPPLLLVIDTRLDAISTSDRLVATTVCNCTLRTVLYYGMVHHETPSLLRLVRASRRPRLFYTTHRIKLLVLWY